MYVLRGGVVRQEKVGFLHSGTGMEAPRVCKPSYPYLQIIITNKLIPSVILAVQCLEINFKLGKRCL